MTRYTVALDAKKRLDAMGQWLFYDGLVGLTEDPNIGYGAIALTSLGNGLDPRNEEVKSCIQSRQLSLQRAANEAGITLYDPASSPLSPDLNLSAHPREIFMTDTARIAVARHVTFVDVIATTGAGIELEKARRLGKFLYVFHDPDVRTSRMQPDRSFHLSLSDFEENRRKLTEVFSFVNQHEPCIGFEGTTPVMLGAHRETGKIVNLEEQVRERWPTLAYQFDGQKSILPMICLDTSQLIESRRRSEASVARSRMTLEA